MTKVLRGPRGKVKAEVEGILALLKTKGTVTIEELATVSRERYIYKHIHFLRKQYPIRSNFQTRKVVSYTLDETGQQVAA